MKNVDELYDIVLGERTYIHIEKHNCVQQNRPYLYFLKELDHSSLFIVELFENSKIDVHQRLVILKLQVLQLATVAYKKN